MIRIRGRMKISLIVVDDSQVQQLNPLVPLLEFVQVG
jgi:hypothetical protein